MSEEVEKLNSGADRCLNLAASTLDPGMRKVLLDAAAQFQEEALRAERRAWRRR